MPTAKRLFFTVINELSYDQRMIRICGSLAQEGYDVTLVGRKLRNAPLPGKRPFRQKTLRCIFPRGALFYVEYNFRLFFFLLFAKIDLICAIDLDTIVPCYGISKLKGIPRVYDAHELFCEMKEVATRPFVHWCWKIVERWMVPAFQKGYTVNSAIAEEFNRLYGVHYAVVRNVPLLDRTTLPSVKERCILYQGAVNEGRSFETLIPAMKQVNAPLIICGDGNFMTKARALVKEHGLEHKIVFKGKLIPSELREVTRRSYIGVTLFDKLGLSNYYSLANRFFDYMHASVPQVCVNYPLYSEIVTEYPCALLLDDIGTDNLALQLNRLLSDEQLYLYLQDNCLRAREALNWQEEEKILITFYRQLFRDDG